MTYFDAFSELSEYERSELAAVHRWAVEKFGTYRRRGLSHREAFRAALAWGRNVTEGRIRHLTHGTGAVR